MARKKKQDRENESLAASGMEADRAERMRGAGTYGDAQAGDEGVDDPAMSRSHRDDMRTMPGQGDQPGTGSSESSQREMSQRSERTGQRANDERFDDASDFGGQGGQRENSDENAEGTGYRGRERSNTENSSRDNPLS